MRERSTWNPDNIRKQATAMSKRAEDPTAMNQDHLSRQPPADKYLTGDPSTFAEDVHPSAKNWKAEYSNGQTSRNEIGMPEMRDDTFNHPEVDPGSSPARGGGGRQASLDEETLTKKADLCCKVARQILGPKAVEAAIEDQALALMVLTDSDLIATVNRMAQQDEQQQGQQEQGQKQAQLPPEFIENMKKKEDGAKDKEDDKKQAQAQDQQQAQGQGQEQREAGQMPDFIKDKIEEKKEKDEKEASAPRQATLDQMSQQLQQMAQQIQQMMSQQQQAPMAQQQVQVQQDPMQEQQQQLDQMLQQQSNDQMIDQMLQQPQQMAAAATVTNELGVELTSASMDIDEVLMTPADDVLSTLFANNTEVQNAQHAHTLQYGAPAPMQVQASGGMSRTASTRTIGTRPTAGVSAIGGLGSPAPTPSGGDVEKLSNLWNSAPDVSDVFRS